MNLAETIKFVNKHYKIKNMLIIDKANYVLAKAISDDKMFSDCDKYFSGTKTESLELASGVKQTSLTIYVTKAGIANFDTVCCLLKDVYDKYGARFSLAADVNQNVGAEYDSKFETMYLYSTDWMVSSVSMK